MNSHIFNPNRFIPDDANFLTPEEDKRHDLSWLTFLPGKFGYPYDKVCRMMSNIVCSMFLTAMPEMKLEYEKAAIPPTNMLVYPMNDIIVKSELPLRIGRAAPQELHD